MSNPQLLKLPNNLIGQRLDAALANHTGQSRSYWQRAIKSGRVLVNDAPAKAHQSLTVNSLITVLEEEPTLTKGELPLIKLNIIFEDEDLIVINKKAGQVVHPGVGQSQESIAEALIRHYPSIINARYTDSTLSYDRAGIVHRLDKDTSGVMVVAKNYETLINLQQQFKDRVIKKKYVALVFGHCRDQIISKPIGRHPKYRRKQAVANNEFAKPAFTRIFVKKSGAVNGQPVSYVSCYPKTGRMHQIRVHLQSINNCILGDPLYNTKKSRQASEVLKVNRLLLHAYRLNFIHPKTGHVISFLAPLPKDLSTIIHSLTCA